MKTYHLEEGFESPPKFSSSLRRGINLVWARRELARLLPNSTRRSFFLSAKSGDKRTFSPTPQVPILTHLKYHIATIGWKRIGDLAALEGRPILLKRASKALLDLKFLLKKNHIWARRELTRQLTTAAAR